MSGPESTGHQPVVSVVMPCYNSEAYLPEAVGSVLKQTMEDWELLLVDDASTDRTAELCREFASADDRITFIPLTANGGPAVARNAAIGRSRGRFVAFLDSDDLWYPQKLQVQLDRFREDGPPLVYSSYDVLSRDGGRRRTRIAAPPQVTFDDLLTGCPIGCLTAVYDTSRVGRVLMPDLRQRQDWGLWLRILKRCDGAVGVDESLAALRKRSDSLTANKARATYYSWRLLRTEGGCGFWMGLYGVGKHVAGAVKRQLYGVG